MGMMPMAQPQVPMAAHLAMPQAQPQIPMAAPMMGTGMAQPVAAIPVTQGSPEGSGLVEELQRLGQMKAQGILTEEQFNAAKERVLGMNAPGGVTTTTTMMQPGLSTDGIPMVTGQLMTGQPYAQRV